MRTHATHVTKRVMGMNVDGWRGRSKKSFIDCVNDMLEKGVDDAMTLNRREWKKMT